MRSNNKVLSISSYLYSIKLFNCLKSYNDFDLYFLNLFSISITDITLDQDISGGCYVVLLSKYSAISFMKYINSSNKNVSNLLKIVSIGRSTFSLLSTELDILISPYPTLDSILDYFISIKSKYKKIIFIVNNKFNPNRLNKLKDLYDISIHIGYKIHDIYSFDIEALNNISVILFTSSISVDIFIRNSPCSIDNFNKLCISKKIYDKLFKYSNKRINYIDSPYIVDLIPILYSYISDF